METKAKSDGASAGIVDVAVLDDDLTIACGFAALRPTRIQRAGKPAMDVAAFLRGRAVPAGTVVE